MIFILFVVDAEVSDVLKKKAFILKRPILLLLTLDLDTLLSKKADMVHTYWS